MRPAEKWGCRGAAGRTGRKRASDQHFFWKPAKSLLNFPGGVCIIKNCNCRCDGIGRRDGLKIRWWRHRVGSSPTTGTTSSRTSYRSRRRFLFQSKRHLSFTPSLLLSAKGHARLACSLVNALTTARCRYQPFAGFRVCRYHHSRQTTRGPAGLRVVCRL